MMTTPAMDLILTAIRLSDQEKIEMKRENPVSEDLSNFFDCHDGPDDILAHLKTIIHTNAMVGNKLQLLVAYFTDILAAGEDWIAITPSLFADWKHP